MGAKEMYERYKEYRDHEMKERAVRKQLRKKKAAFDRDTAKAKPVSRRKFSGARYLAAMPNTYGEQGRKILKKRKSVIDQGRKIKKLKKRARKSKAKSKKTKKTIIIYK